MNTRYIELVSGTPILLFKIIFVLKKNTALDDKEGRILLPKTRKLADKEIFFFYNTVRSNKKKLE
jgi:hypothetical protein